MYVCELTTQCTHSCQRDVVVLRGSVARHKHSLCTYTYGSYFTNCVYRIHYRSPYSVRNIYISNWWVIKLTQNHSQLLLFLNFKMFWIGLLECEFYTIHALLSFPISVLFYFFFLLFCTLFAHHTKPSQAKWVYWVLIHFFTSIRIHLFVDSLRNHKPRVHAQNANTR